MKRCTCLTLTALVLVLAAISSPAIDRDAGVSETLRVQGISGSDGDGVAIDAVAEIGLQSLEQQWALIFSLGAGNVEMDGAADADVLRGSIGLKAYANEGLCSLSVAWAFEQYDYGTDADVGQAVLTAKHRLVPADQPMSPYITGALTARSSDRVARHGQGAGSFSQLLMDFGGGCDLRLSESVALVFEAGYFTATETRDRSPQPDSGFRGSVALAYDWHRLWPDR